jgi:anti-sigma factor RsiW
MRCSSFEPLLDEFVDGTLAPPDHARVTAHVAECNACSGLLQELRVIDALLMTPRQLEPAPNFTFKIMAEVRALPAPQAHHRFPFAALGTYIAFAWLTFAAFLYFGGASVRASIAALMFAGSRAAHSIATAAGASGHLFGHNVYGITAAMGALLGFDLLAAAGVFYLFVALRARRLASEGSTE